MSRPLPPHGTYSRAVIHKCDCRNGCHSYRMRRAYDRSNGVSGRTDATQVRVHLERLIARGWTQDQIAAASGLNQATISIILSGQYKGVHKKTAAAIFDIRLNQTPPIPRGLVDATGTRRRLQALAVLGYNLTDVARQSGVAQSSLQQTLKGDWGRVRTLVATRVARVYRQLAMRPAPASRSAEQSRNQAMILGWHGPMAWADIDDPACRPDPGEPAAPCRVHADDVAELAAAGLDDGAIGRRLNASPRTVLRARAVYGIPSGVAS